MLEQPPAKMHDIIPMARKLRLHYPMEIKIKNVWGILFCHKDVRVLTTFSDDAKKY